MYTDEDLNSAVKDGIFTTAAVEQFRQSVETKQHSPSVDEENFKLMTGFNDIFVVIACALLLISSVFVLRPFSEPLAYFLLAAISWALAEFFVLKRKMSLPAIVLLLTFVGGIFAFISSFFSELTSTSAMIAAAGSALASYIHWLRFKVPITIAAGVIAFNTLIISVLLALFPSLNKLLLFFFFIGGLFSFAIAMYWDAQDVTRTTYKADIAFWLHLLSAPLIIHPVFSSLGVLDGNESLVTLTIVIALYVVMTLISLVIDRRAFMVSSLVYVIYALSNIMENIGGISYGFALTGALMGGVLLLLSGFWQVSRKVLIEKLPQKITNNVPVIVEK